MNLYVRGVSVCSEPEGGFHAIPPRRKISLTPLEQMSVPFGDAFRPSSRKPAGMVPRISDAGSTAEDLDALASDFVDGISLNQDSVEDRLFDLFKEKDRDLISISRFLQELGMSGLKKSDPRLAEMIGHFRACDGERRAERADAGDVHDVMHLLLDRDQFKACVAPAMVLVVRALQNQLIIPDWGHFCDQIGDIYRQCKDLTSGENASYIPQLARMNPNYWGVSVCTVDGQRASWGDTAVPFCFQSVSKAFNYAIALSNQGSDEVHNWVGQEPSGRLFNEICLNHQNKPHNPMINAGAIVISSLIQKDKSLADRFDFVMNMYKAFAGNGGIGFSNQTFLSERESADRNFALAYYLREYGGFPPGSKLAETLDFYFQMCSMEATADTMAVMTSTLANGGICPLTNERVVSNRACRDTLSLMHSCGMYDYSGQWAFKVGLPAKSGVSGVICVVIPNEMGICLFAPPLDRCGNSVKGIAFAKELVQRFNFHNYDSILHAENQKIDPRRRQNELRGETIVYVMFAAKAGDVNAMKQYVMRGMSLEMQDYDGRTALHIAAAEGHLHVLHFLRDLARVDPQPRDRWERTPLDDARHFAHKDCIRYLEDWLRAFGRCEPASPTTKFVRRLGPVTSDLDPDSVSSE